ncbi:hypothetical protein LTR91_001665 [Friedmanniomyces endolithicus]|uniref:ABM domain-containing protein n=1 Tax=Friedmanniomyces endolithicus TaxID=329885 RepID=A0AAN6L113_9PEZI|nr:hypothetical protein LTR35_003840 [Friedmanniomyces endolithicus]KAK0324857.1 hypothetical protein LTR82_003843 [Friedmanniomyces endolithicus]KAK0966343.1 hypothetical protein LTS01_017840 [Friedmanniomyces endolithicus]KAK1000112.1 hypothetical protein LTR54_009035 [Friedmanniomyces endolithicus]KAK1012422.1 hypothetical protein LTR91_001665 [Friedmanniomyces endolithicus]
MVTTEYVLFPIKAGFDPTDANGQAAPIVLDVNQTMTAVSGMQGMYSGLQLEDPSKWQLMCIWDKAQSHYDFQASAPYGPFVERLFKIVDPDRKVTGLHIDFHGDILKTFAAPVTETAFFYFEGGPPSDYYDGAKKCLRTWAEKADGLHSWAVGTTYEDVEEEGIKGKAVVLSLGWQTKEHHVEFNKTDLCKEHGKALVSGSKKLTAWYVRATSSGTSLDLADVVLGTFGSRSIKGDRVRTISFQEIHMHTMFNGTNGYTKQCRHYET